MRTQFLLLVAVLASASAGAQTRSVNRNSPFPGVTIVTFREVAYGSLEFDGSVERVDFGDEWEYRVMLNATFRADAKVNHVISAQLRAVAFTAMPRSTAASARSYPLVNKTEPIYVTLNNDGERQALPAVAFRVPKVDVAAAAHIGLGVLGSGATPAELRRPSVLLWPIPIELR